MTPQLGGDIDENWFSSNYDPTVQAALASSDDAFVIVDLVRLADIINFLTSLTVAVASTTMLGGTDRLLLKAGRLTTSLRRSGPNWRPSTAPTSVSFCTGYQCFV